MATFRMTDADPASGGDRTAHTGRAAAGFAGPARRWPETEQHAAGGFARQGSATDNLSFAEAEPGKSPLQSRG